MLERIRRAPVRYAILAFIFSHLMFFTVIEGAGMPLDLLSTVQASESDSQSEQELAETLAKQLDCRDTNWLEKLLCVAMATGIAALVGSLLLGPLGTIAAAIVVGVLGHIITEVCGCILDGLHEFLERLLLEMCKLDSDLPPGVCEIIYGNGTEGAKSMNN